MQKLALAACRGLETMNMNGWSLGQQANGRGEAIQMTAARPLSPLVTPCCLPSTPSLDSQPTSKRRCVLASAVFSHSKAQRIKGHCVECLCFIEQQHC